MYIVECLLDKRTVGSATEYLVKWKGYEVEDSTWEVEANLVSGGLVARFETNRAAGYVHPGEPVLTWATIRSLRGVCNSAKHRETKTKKSAGLLVAAAMCGTIVAAQELLRCESLTQVGYAARVACCGGKLTRRVQVVGFLYGLTKHKTDDEFGRLIVFYDDGCHLRQFLEIRHKQLGAAVRNLHAIPMHTMLTYAADCAQAKGTSCQHLRHGGPCSGTSFPQSARAHLHRPLPLPWAFQGPHVLRALLRSGAGEGRRQ